MREPSPAPAVAPRPTHPARRDDSDPLLEQVMATLPVGVVVIDRAGDIILVNAASTRLWGGDHIVSGPERWARSKAWRHESGEPMAPTDLPSVRAVSKGETILNELIDIAAYDGKRKPVQISAAPIRDADGQIVGAVVVNEDVTERVRAETALRESASQLQQLSRRLLAVQEEERRHLSRELHDEFGQILATIAVHLHAAKELPGEARSRIEDCIALLERAGAQVRNLALELRPWMLETAGLDDTLRWLADRHQQQTGIATRVVGHLGEVAGDLAIACFRAVQEALTNVVRHARARQVWIELSRRESALELVVRDDGVGFDVSSTLARAAGEGHLGLLGMRERIQILRGTVEARSEPGHGTRIRILLPLLEGTAEQTAPAA